MSVLILCRCIFMGTGEADDASPIPFLFLNMRLVKKLQNNSDLSFTFFKKFHIAPIYILKGKFPVAH